jgi:hypothetical protein
LISCNSALKNANILPIEFEAFEASFSKPFTNDLKHYQYGLEWWKNPYYTDAIAHFPDTLFTHITYDFFFTPTIMQGQSSIALKLKFDNLKLAEDFFKAKTIRNAEKEFPKYEELKKSLFCYPEEFGFPSRYKLPNDSETILFQAPKCGGQGEDVLGGIQSGIAIDRSSNSIVCWARDLSV